MTVYAIKSGKHLKIGHSRDVSQRLANLQSATGDDLELVSTVEGGRELEATIHQRLSEKSSQTWR